MGTLTIVLYSGIVMPGAAGPETNLPGSNAGAAAAAQAEAVQVGGARYGNWREQIVTMIANLAPSRRGKGFKGASQKPLNIKKPIPSPAPPPKRK